MSGDHVEHTHKVNIKSICEFKCLAGVTLVFNPLNIAAMGYFQRVTDQFLTLKNDPVRYLMTHPHMKKWPPLKADQL